MSNKDKSNSPLKAYAVASQFAFTIISPLLVFIVGGYFACRHFGWSDGVMLIFVILGIVFMLCGGLAHLSKMIRLYGKDNEKAPKVFTTTEDNDYYDDYND